MITLVAGLWNKSGEDFDAGMGRVHCKVAPRCMCREELPVSPVFFPTVVFVSGREPLIPLSQDACGMAPEAPVLLLAVSPIAPSRLHTHSVHLG